MLANPVNLINPNAPLRTRVDLGKNMSLIYGS
jgi:hypothetical protein